MGGTISGLVVLGFIRKQAEQARESKPVKNIPPWPLHQLLLPDLLEFQSWLPWWWTAAWKCKPNKPFPPQLASCHDVFAGIETLTKTVLQLLSPWSWIPSNPTPAMKPWRVPREPLMLNPPREAPETTAWPKLTSHVLAQKRQGQTDAHTWLSP